MAGRSDLPACLGGPAWRPRGGTLLDDLGHLWAPCGIHSEWGPLREVLLHRPGRELEGVGTPDQALMLEIPEAEPARRQHDALSEAYRSAGVAVHYVSPDEHGRPNLMFVADLLFMTREGAIVGRPAGAARAGEERWVHRALRALGIPILRTVGGTGTFEGADAMWLDPETVVIATGIRTNDQGAAQVTRTLEELDVSVVRTRLPRAEMHLMGVLRIVDPGLAFVREGRLESRSLSALSRRGYEVRAFPEGEEVSRSLSHNVVTLAPRRVLMPERCPETRRFYEAAGVECLEVAVDEIVKAAGGIGCLTGVLRRD